MRASAAPARLGAAWRHPIGVFLACLALYLSTMPRTAALEDDGFFILAAWFNGIAHPPGYPLFTLIAHPFTQIPWGSVAMRVHTASALCGALACAVLWGIGRELGLKHGMATLVALMFGGSAIFWSQSIVAEVYALNGLLLFLALYTGLRLSRAEAGERRWLAPLLGLLFGLGLANHWPLVVLTAPGILLMLWPRLPQLWRYLPSGTLALLVGLTPYLWLYLRSQQAPFASFYGPLRDFSDLFYVISRQGFSDIDNSPSAGWGDKLGFLQFFLGELAHQFSYAALPFLPIGLWRQFRCLPPERIAGLIWIFFANSLLLILLLNFDHEPLFESIFRVYPIIAYSVAALWVGVGLAEGWRWLAPRLSGTAARRAIPTLAGLLLIGGTLANGADTNLRQDYRWTERFAEQFFDTVAPGAAVFVDGDIQAGVMGYFRYVEEWRPDLTLYSSVGRIFGTRLFEPLGTNLDIQQAALDAFVAQDRRPIHYASPFLATPFGAADLWLHKQVRRDLGHEITLLPDPAPWFPFLEFVLSGDRESDQWTLFLRDELLRGIVPHLANRAETETAPERAALYRAWLDRVVAASPGAELAWVCEMVQRYPDRQSPLELARRLERLRALPWSALPKRDHALPDHLLGVLHERAGKSDLARHDYRESIRRWNHPDNPALQALAKLDEGRR